MTTLFRSFALIALLACQTALAAEPSPFRGFLGSYVVEDVECLRDGYPWRGCSVVRVSVLETEGRLAIQEIDDDLSLTFHPETYSRGSGDARVDSILSGDGENEALWERYETKKGEKSLIDLRFFFRDNGTEFYHVVWRDGAVNGVWRIMKATYRLSRIRGTESPYLNTN